MTTVLAAIDGTPASPGVLIVAKQVARSLGADVDAVHVVDDGDAAGADERVSASGLTLRLLRGSVAPALVAEASAEGVDAAVLGLRRTLGRADPVGSVALEVIDRADAIVVGVPPAISSSYELRTVLIPIQGRPAEALARVVRLARGVRLDLVVVHVHDEGSIPSFEDQSHYDVEAWADEFLARWIPGVRERAVVEVRVGVPEEQILTVARDRHADMIAIGWDRDRSPGRSTVVRALLRRAAVPIALLPLRVRDPVAVPI